MTTKYGDFVEPAFNCRGDPYPQRVTPGERDLGLNFKATTGKRGKVRILAFAMTLFLVSLCSRAAALRLPWQSLPTVINSEEAPVVTVSATGEKQ